LIVVGDDVGDYMTADEMAEAKHKADMDDKMKHQMKHKMQHMMQHIERWMTR